MIFYKKFKLNKILGKRLKVENNGKNNNVIKGKNSKFRESKIVIDGNNNIVIFGKIVKLKT